MKKKRNFKYIMSWFMYFVGFIGYVAFLSAIHNISEEAWWYAIGSDVGIFLLTASGYLRQ